MKDLNVVMEQMLNDFDEFERAFLQPYVIQTEHNNIKLSREDTKVVENLNVFQEDVDKKSGCCMAGRNGEKVCCNGKCWAYLERRWRKMEKIPRGRRKKGTEVNLEVRKLCKEHQKIRNRLSAAEFYRKQKAYIQDLEMQVKKLQAENKIRRNLAKFLQSNLQLQHRKQRLDRTMSLPLNLEYRVHRYIE